MVLVIERSMMVTVLKENKATIIGVIIFSLWIVFFSFSINEIKEANKQGIEVYEYVKIKKQLKEEKRIEKTNQFNKMIR